MQTPIAKRTPLIASRIFQFLTVVGGISTVGASCASTPKPAPLGSTAQVAPTGNLKPSAVTKPPARSSNTPGVCPPTFEQALKMHHWRETELVVCPKGIETPVRITPRALLNSPQQKGGIPSCVYAKGTCGPVMVNVTKHAIVRGFRCVALAPGCPPIPAKSGEPCSEKTPSCHYPDTETRCQKGILLRLINEMEMVQFCSPARM